MRAQKIDDDVPLIAASIVAQPSQPSTEISPPQSAQPLAGYSPSTSTAAIPKFWLELHHYVSVARKR